MIGSFLSAWLLFPTVLLGVSVGCGLLVRRVAGGELSTPLIAPVGFALVVVICSFACSYEATAPAAGAVVAIVAALGILFEVLAAPPARAWGGRLRERLRRRQSGWAWPLVAGLVVFAAIGGPVFLTGEVGWTGYTRIVDIAFQFDFAQHVANAGRSTPAAGDSSYNIVVTKLLGVGYPGGSQATLGATATLIGANVAWCYQAFLGFAAAMGALAIYSLLGRVTSNGLMRCIGAAVAIQPNVLYGYALEAGIKELTTAALLITAVAVCAERLPGEGRRRAMVPMAVAVAASFATFSLGIAPWLGLLLLGTLIVSFGRGRGRRLYVLQSWAVFTIVAVLISLPSLITAAKLASVAGAAVGGVVDLGLGNLAAPVSRWSSAGVWLTSDYRFPLQNAAPSHIFDVIVLVLAAFGVLAALVRRRWTIVIVGVMAPIALYYFIEHSTAWIQFKSLTITAAFALTLAFAGAAALQASRRRALSALGWLAALVVAGAVLYGNALIYHDTTLAPGGFYHDLAQIATRYQGQGPALDPYWDEYAEYLLRGEKATSIVNPANFDFQVRPGVAPAGTSFEWDLNQLVPAFLQSFPLIIQPRSPVASRAPSNYDLVERTRWFDVWRRDRPSRTVFFHAPLSGLPHERTPALCRLLVAKARLAGTGAQVAYTENSVAAEADPVVGTHPSYWRALAPGTLGAKGAGTDTMSVALPSQGRYELWVQGSLGRPLTVSVDGRRLSSIGWEERYPGQYLLIGTVQLGAGRHTLRVVRGNGSLHPGSGDPVAETTGRVLGAFVFNRADGSAETVHVAPAAQTAQVCARPIGYRWIELLRPGGAPRNVLPAS